MAREGGEPVGGGTGRGLIALAERLGVQVKL
jgi:hypothetical protein